MASTQSARALGVFAALLMLACSSDDNGDSGSTNGASSTGSDSGTTGASTGSATGSSTGSSTGSGPSGGDAGELEPFSFFVTSLESMQKLSKSQSGFGGDLRYGETGAGAGLRGADKICAEIADIGMPGASSKQWRAFLSATDDGAGNQVNAIERIGEGPWYDRTGRLLAANLTDLKTTRPTGADTAIINDFPNEFGVPNHDPDGTGQVDNHDMLTGTNDEGELFGDEGSTCKDWTSAVGADGTPRVGHSWPRGGGGGGGGGTGRPGGGGGGGSGENWMSALNEAGCAPGVSLIEMGPPNPADPTVGSGGGYGGIYCFALTP